MGIDVGLIGSSCTRVVVGLGQTGMSCARYLNKKGLPFRVMDTRQSLPVIDEFRKQFPSVQLHTGSLNEEWLLAADEVLLSPGISLNEPGISLIRDKGISVIGDIELFVREVSANYPHKPILAITGSNGKSTVTTLVGEMVRESGLIPGVGGNIGTPALDLLENKSIDVYVLELSSFQLETTETPRAAAATILNMTPDHMDRYATMAEYHKAKQRIYRGCLTAVFNRDDHLTSPLLPDTAHSITFGYQPPDLGQMGVIVDEDGTWLCRGLDRLINVSDIKIKGKHNQLNALAALALGEAIDLNINAMTRVLSRFNGLPHRCHYITEHDGVKWFNDSKATNVGSAIASIEGIGEFVSGGIVLIAGGDGKGADFSCLKPVVKKYVNHLVLIGRDAYLIHQAIGTATKIHYAESMADAVYLAGYLAGSNDAVLLAPACASFDMFNSFEERGDRFTEFVQKRCLC